MKTTQLPFFVYGTLRKEYGNYRALLEGKTDRIINGATTGEMFSVGGFPAVIKGTEAIVGEIMYVKPELYEKVLRGVDNLEGYDPTNKRASMYLREVVEVVNADGEVIKANMYIWNRATVTLTKVESGDWKEFSPPGKFNYSAYYTKGFEDDTDWHVVVVNTDNGERLAVSDECDYKLYEVIEDYLTAEEAVETVKALSAEWHIDLFDKSKDKVLVPIGGGDKA